MFDDYIYLQNKTIMGIYYGRDHGYFQTKNVADSLMTTYHKSYTIRKSKEQCKFWGVQIVPVIQ